MYICMFVCVYIYIHIHISMHVSISEQESALFSFRSYFLLGISLQVFSSLFASRVLGVNARANWRKVCV